MIGLTIITQLVYWYRDLKTHGLDASERRQIVNIIEMKKITVPTSTASSSIVDYITPYEQPWTDMGNLEWNSYGRRIEIQERELNSQGTERSFTESNINGSALVNYEPMELHLFDSGARYSECSALNTNGSALENPERMEWNSYDSGVRLSECQDWIVNGLTKSELSEVSGPVSKQIVVPDNKTNSEEDYDNERRRRWERNEMDYMGQDSFQNILAKLEKSLIN